MSTVAEQTYTPEDLLTMPDRKRYELVDGQLVERHMSRLSSWVGGQLISRSSTPSFGSTSSAGLGRRSRLRLFPRLPQEGAVSRRLVRDKHRLPEGLTSDGYIYVPPDLAVEVVSPNDRLTRSSARSSNT